MPGTDLVHCAVLAQYGAMPHPVLTSRVLVLPGAIRYAMRLRLHASLHGILRYLPTHMLRDARY
eukprot:2448873-Rhodomonas_salina.3